MNIVYFLLPIALLLGLGFVAAFIYSSWSGQFDDLDTPAHRILFDADNGPHLKNPPATGGVFEMGSNDSKKGKST